MKAEWYSIANMALWGWARGAAYIFGNAGLTAYPAVDKLVQSVSQRPAAQRAAKLVVVEGERLELAAVGEGVG